MKEFLKNLKKAWPFAKSEKKNLIKFLISSIMTSSMGIVIPILGAKIIVYLTSEKFYQLLLMSVFLFIVGNIVNVFRYFSRKSSLRVYNETYTNLQTTLGSEILKLENNELDKNGSGVFIQRLTNDTSKLSEVFNIIIHNLTGIFMDIGILIAVFIINKIAFVYFVVVILLLYFINNTAAKRKTEKDEIYRKKQEKGSGLIGELVRGARDIKMLNAENSFLKELKNRVKEINASWYEMEEIGTRYDLLGDFTFELTDLLLIFLLVSLIYLGQIEVAMALVIQNYSYRVTSVVYYINTLIKSVKDFNLSAKRVFAILDKREFKKESFGKIHLNHIEGNFEFKNVHFKYNKTKVLNGVSFKVNSNETVAFVGKSGAGKTTIFNLLCKMYEINKGVITIDDINIKKLDKDTIRGNITIISQNPYIFNMTIKENLKLVKESVTDEEIKEACKMASLDKFINSLPKKYDTLIGEGGINLSGGQRQRLAIARALLQNTEIILFDEATSALDNETQKEIQESIEKMKNKYTILIIAHRLSTIVNSDKIVFLNNGVIESVGKHKDLLKTNKNYKELYESEIKKKKIEK